MRRRHSVDKTFLGISLVLLVGGYFIFTSASFGLLLKDGGIFTNTALTQLAAIALGLVLCYVASRIPLSFIREYAWLWLTLGAVLMALVFVPGLGVAYGGAERWLSVFGISLQPGEFLKLSLVVALAAWLTRRGAEKDTQRKKTFWVFSVLLAGAGALFLSQPDTDSFAIVLAAGVSLYAVAGFPLKHLLTLGATALVLAVFLFSARPYLLERLTVFLNPDRDPLGAGYQLQQSLIAVGSGGITGKGFGKSVQKFNRLPEPTNDSIFAVFAEEFGLIGSGILVLLFAALALRGLRIAARSPDMFARLIATGCTVLISGAAFLNFASMLGLAPLSGLALPFISHGGSAMLGTLIGVGLILNVSRHGV